MSHDIIHEMVCAQVTEIFNLKDNHKFYITNIKAPPPNNDSKIHLHRHNPLTQGPN
jgi:hypothetical protein